MVLNRPNTSSFDLHHGLWRQLKLTADQCVADYPIRSLRLVKVWKSKWLLNPEIYIATRIKSKFQKPLYRYKTSTAPEWVRTSWTRSSAAILIQLRARNAVVFALSQRKFCVGSNSCRTFYRFVILKNQVYISPEQASFGQNDTCLVTLMQYRSLEAGTVADEAS